MIERTGRGGGHGNLFAVMGGLIVVLQAVLGLRVVMRMLRGIETSRIVQVPEPGSADRSVAGLSLGDRVTVIVPVLNERERLGPCLDGLLAQGQDVAQILVVDGGSTDGTPAFAEAYRRRDERVRLLDASPVGDGWNGKAWNLQTGFAAADPAVGWVLTIDADVRPQPGLVRALVAQAKRERVRVLSAATQQVVTTAGGGIVHPALLTTLVYRFGIPGYATDQVHRVQANGQCMLMARSALERIGGFAVGRDTVCEDVTIARRLAAAGYRVGFYETDDLVRVEMYTDAREAWDNWTRSLPMRDRYSGMSTVVGLAEVALVQALPIPLTLWLRSRSARGLAPNRAWEHGDLASFRGEGGASPVLRIATVVNVILVAVRLGTLSGMGRAYRQRPWTYWLSPVADIPVAMRLMQSAIRRRHTWRGRVLVRGDGNAGDVRNGRYQRH